MKKKLLSFILSLCCVVSCTFILSACSFSTDKNNNENDDTSAHNFSEEWVYDDDCHWHTCLDDDCDKESKHQSHNYGQDNKCIQCGTLKSSTEYLNFHFESNYAEVESIKEGAPSCIKIPTHAKNDKGEKFLIKDINLTVEGTDTAGNIKELIIPNYVERISGDFENFTNLESLTIPSLNIFYCHVNRFSNLKISALKHLTITQTLTLNVGEFSGYKSLESVKILEYNTALSGQCFYCCTGLKSVSLPSSLTKIDYQAFMGCTSLTSIEIPNSVTSIQYEAFEDCSGLTSITIPSGATVYEKAFMGCTGLKTATILNGVTSISSRMFYECSGLASIEIPNSVTTISDEAFSDCTSLTHITIPDSVTYIGKFAFMGCSNLTNVIIPNSVTTIGMSAFEGCSNFTNVRIPESVTSIGSSVFASCSNLSYAEICANISTLGAHTFSGCTNLTEIVIPKTLTEIKNSCFKDCSNLTSIYFKGTQAEYSITNISTDGEQDTDANATSGNLPFKNATVYYYSAEQPTTSGNYWYYTGNGVVSLWD